MAEPRDTAADEEKDTYDVRLKNALQNLRSAKKDYHCIVNLAKPADLFWLDRNPVSAKHRLMLTGLTGSKNFSKAGTARRYCWQRSPACRMRSTACWPTTSPSASGTATMCSRTGCRATRS